MAGTRDLLSSMAQAVNIGFYAHAVKQITGGIIPYEGTIGLRDCRQPARPSIPPRFGLQTSAFDAIPNLKL